MVIRLPVWTHTKGWSCTLAPHLEVLGPFADRQTRDHEDRHEWQMTVIGTLRYWWLYLTNYPGFRLWSEADAFQDEMHKSVPECGWDEQIVAFSKDLVKFPYYAAPTVGLAESHLRLHLKEVQEWHS